MLYKRHMLTGIMVLLSSSTGPELKLKVDNTIPHAFQRVMAAVASSSLTIGENNKKKKACRAAQWYLFVVLPSIYIATATGLVCIAYNKPVGRLSFPWWLPVIMLWGIYMAVVEAAMCYVNLLLPQAPLAAWEALQYVGLEKIGTGITLTFGPVLLCNQAIVIAWSSLVYLLIDVILDFWVCLVRAYGK